MTRCELLPLRAELPWTKFKRSGELKVNVFASWLENTPPLVGTLYCNFSRGSEVQSFEFTKDWLRLHSDIMIDPDLYNTTGRQYVPQGKKTFGMFADCSPDRWGRKLLQRREAITADEEGRTPNTLREIDYLLGVSDKTRMGGLRFKIEGTNEYCTTSKGMEVPPIESIRKLEDASLSLESNEDMNEAKWLEMLIEPGSSLGGARPKATVKDTDGSLWVAKFPSRHDDNNTGAWEIAVNALAVMCGINVSKARGVQFNKKGTTFLSKRFDRKYTGGKVQRVHYVSAMTVLGMTDGDTGASYLDIASFIKEHGTHPKEDLKELWHRVLFNVLVSNTDDHLRNHGFLLDGNGFRLSPAFDINPDTAKQCLHLNITENDNDKRLSLVMDTAKYYGLSQDAAREDAMRIAATVKDNWRPLAMHYGITEKEIASMANAFEDAAIFGEKRKQRIKHKDAKRCRE